MSPPPLDTEQSAQTAGEPSFVHELIIWAGGAARSLKLDAAGVYVVGRSPQATIHIEDATVSREHARLHVADDEFFVEDLGSSNGTMVKGIRLMQGAKVRVAPGMTVMLGGVSLSISRRGGQGTASSEGLLPVTTGNSDGDPIIADERMREVYTMARALARTALSILVLGETGAGKELLAAEIHRASARASGPFVDFNCAALPEALVESELFGYERGAFTGATTTKPGLFEVANGGTLFLDEVGDMPLAVQAKLLRVLETRKLQRLGATRPRDIDVRVVAATHRELTQAVGAGTFRSDLYFRLGGAVLRVPPLRGRPGEILPLTRHFLDKAATRLGQPSPQLTPGAIQVLLTYPWPGNVRELRNVAERALALASGGVIGVEHLGLDAPSSAWPGDGDVERTAVLPILRPPSAEPPPPKPGPAQRAAPMKDREAERRRIQEALSQAGGSQTRAAELLSLSRYTLMDRMDELGIPRPRKRGAG